MAQYYSVVARKNPGKPAEAAKFYAAARSGKKVKVREVCKRIAERSSYSKGELNGAIGEFLIEIANVLEEGNIVQLGELGNFRMSLRTAKATATAEEFKASCIEKGKVLFYPGKELRKLENSLEFELYKGAAASADEDEDKDPDVDPDPDDGKGDGDQGGDKGQGGDDDDEAPNPGL